MSYKACISAFEKIAARGIPIRDPKGVKVWARRALWRRMEEFGERYHGCVAGSLRWPYVSDAKWASYVDNGYVRYILDVDRCKAMWESLGLPDSPAFTGSPHDMDVLSRYDGECSFAGSVYALLKAKSRLQGLCGGWLSGYRDGRLYYPSLHPLSSSTGRCTPCPSEGFLPGMGHEIVKALLCPPSGRAVSVLDFKANGLSILAALSHDPAMMAVVRAKKDPYLGLGRLLKLVPDTDYSSLSADELKVKYVGERDTCKKLMMAYQYGAGAKRLGGILGYTSDDRCRSLKSSLDTLFSVYTAWRASLPDTCTLPDGFTSTAKIPSVAWAQGYDAYILRQIVTRIQLPKDVWAIATNHDSVWVEHPLDFDPYVVARFMEDVAKEALGDDAFFRVTLDTVRP